MGAKGRQLFEDADPFGREQVQVAQTPDLVRIALGQEGEAGEVVAEGGGPVRVRSQELLLAGQQVPAHPGLGAHQVVEDEPETSLTW
jgi:hypothetical protein